MIVVLEDKRSSSTAPQSERLGDRKRLINEQSITKGIMLLRNLMKSYHSEYLISCKEEEFIPIIPDMFLSRNVIPVVAGPGGINSCR